MILGVIDIALLLVMAVFAIKGAYNGFITAVVSIAGIVLGFIFSFMIHPFMLKFVSIFGLKADVASVAAYIIGFLLIYAAVLIVGYILHSTITFIKLGWFDKILGFFFGFIKAAVVAGVLLWVVVFFTPKDAKAVKEIKESPVAAYVMKITPFIYDKLNNIAGFKRINPFKK